MDLAPERVTREEFVSLYVPGQVICPEGIRTSLAQDRRKGRLVMVHELATSPAEKRRVLNLLPRLGAAHRALVLRVLEVDDEPIVVTKFLLGFVSFREWLEHAVAESSTLIVDTRQYVPDLDLGSHSGTPANLALKTTEFEQVPLNLESVPSLEDTAVGGLARLEGSPPVAARSAETERQRGADAPELPLTSELPFVPPGARREADSGGPGAPSANLLAMPEDAAMRNDAFSDVELSFSDVFGKVAPATGDDSKRLQEPEPPAAQANPSQSLTDLFGGGEPSGLPVESGEAGFATPESPSLPVLPPIPTSERPIVPFMPPPKLVSGDEAATRSSAPQEGARAPDTEPGMTAIFGPSAESQPGASARRISTPPPPGPVHPRASAVESVGRSPASSEPLGVASSFPRPPVVPTDLLGPAGGTPGPQLPAELRAPTLPSFGSQIPDAAVRQHVAPVAPASVGLPALPRVPLPRAPQFNDAAALASEALPPASVPLPPASVPLPPASVPPPPASVLPLLNSSRVEAEAGVREASSVYTEMLQPVRVPSPRIPGSPQLPSVGSLSAAPQRLSSSLAPPIPASVSVPKSRIPWPLVAVLAVSALLVIAVLTYAARQ